MAKLQRITPSLGGGKTKPTKVRPALKTLSPARDPLADQPIIEDPQEACDSEIDALSSGFRERAKAEAERFAGATDGGFYTVLVFESSDQVEAFLKGVGYRGKGDLFIDGRDICDLLGIEVPKADIRWNISDKVDRKLAALPRIGEEAIHDQKSRMGR